MAIQTTKRKRSAGSHSSRNPSSILSRTLLLAILCSHLSPVTASPLPSLPASAPGFRSGAAPAANDALAEPWIDTTDANTDLVAPIPEPESEDDNDDDWELEYEDLARTDEMMGVDGMGNAILQGLDSSTSPQTQPPKPTHLTLPESLLHLFSPGFWKAFLGTFFLFWVLIASTVGALVVVAIRVRRMQRDGRIERAKVWEA